MTPEHADQLQDLLEQNGRDTWPLTTEILVQQRLQEYAALAESDRDLLRQYAQWRTNRPYVVDPIAERIKDAFADLIFGAEPELTAANESDQELLEELADENDLASELQRACGISSSEGEVWWRVYTDQDAYEHPIIDWHSRQNVIPLWRGRKLLAAAFIDYAATGGEPQAGMRVGDASDPAGTRMWTEQQTVARDNSEVWRYVEIHTEGMTRNLLYRGTPSTLGQNVPLQSLPQYADLPDEWRHDLPVMLAGRIPNRLGRRPHVGISDYEGVKDLLYSLNEVASIGQENAKLTLKQRMALPATATAVNEETGERTAPLDRDIIAFTPGSEDLEDPANVAKVLEYSFDAQAFIEYRGDLTDTILTRCRVAPQLVGRHTEAAQTGPALRARLLDSILAANGKARYWDDMLPKILMACQQIEALPEERGGYGRQWANPDEPPVVTRDSVLPADELEEATRHAALVNAGLEARRTAIQDLRPDWDQDEVDEELQRIDDDRAPSAGLGEATISVPRPPISVNLAGNGGATAPEDAAAAPQAQPGDDIDAGA